MLFNVYYPGKARTLPIGFHPLYSLLIQFKNYSETSPKRNGSERNFVFMNYCLNLQNILVSEISDNNEHFL